MSTKPSMQNLNGKCGAAQSPFIKKQMEFADLCICSLQTDIQSIVKGFFCIKR